MQALDERKGAVLQAVVLDYIRTAEPVGSGTIARRYGLGVSPATIRSELAALEEMGYLTQPHPSAGRIPSDLGYRFYVDSLPRRIALSPTQRRAVSAFFDDVPADVEEVLRATAALLSRLTGYVALTLSPRPARSRVLRSELLLVGTAVMLLVVSDAGRVDTQVLDVEEGVAAGAVERVSGSLARVLGGLTYAEAVRRARELGSVSSDREERTLLDGVAAGLSRLRLGPGAEHVFVGGVANIADEESFERETVRGMVEALEDPESLVPMLERPIGGADPEDVTVRIGRENLLRAMREASLVAAWYRGPLGPAGAVALVGPTRMRYRRAISTTHLVARQVSRLMESLAG